MSFHYDPTDLLNESDVEQKFIVELLTTQPPEGLGYTTSDFRSKADLRSFVIDKGQSRKKYYPDYVVILRGLPLLIIEAKAPGADLEEALREAALYAHQVNLLFPQKVNPCSRVVATDGINILAMEWDGGERIEVAMANASAVDDSYSNFIKFARKDTLARDADRIAALIRKQANYVSPVQLMGGRVVAESTVGENSFGANVSIDYKYLFNPESHEDRKKLVENAYITSQRRLSHVAPIDRLIRSTLPTLSNDARGIDDTGSPTQLLSELGDRSRVGELCLLIGSVGSGKSTFTDYLKNKGISPGAARGTDWAHVNLNLAPLAKDSIYAWVIRMISDEVRRLHPHIDMDELAFQRKIYSRQIARLEKGRASLFVPGSTEHANIISAELEKLEGNSELTLEQTIEHLYKNTGRTLIVVLDNCDKRSRDHQLLMFEVATWLKSTMHCMVFLPIRDVTYDTFKNSPPLDTVIKDLVFRIDPPRLDQVIQARLDYAIRETKAAKGRFQYSTENGMRASCEHHEVGAYLSTLVTAIFQNHRFKQVISGLAGRNIRKGIEIVLDICKSGHIPEAEILKARTMHGAKTFPSHLILQILLKGKRRYYSDKETHLKNLFHSDGSDHLPDPYVRVAVLKWLRLKKQNEGPSKIKGFHKTSALVSDLQAHGFLEKNILEAIGDLIDAECCYSESGSAALEMDDLISLAPAGDIHLNMLDDSHYLATVAEATLFRENQPAVEIKEILLGNRRFKPDTRSGQLLVAEVLTDYLNSYFTDFHLAAHSILDEGLSEDLVGMGEIKRGIDRQISGDRPIAVGRARQTEYPTGTVVEARVARLLAGACILSFGEKGQAYLRLSKSDLRETVEGALLTVKILDWNEGHQRFEAVRCTPPH